ncbi:hypothetical protein ACFX13_025563 [Malus domestica]|uniref:Uncharacterized protein n=2 Tax=Malus TaxID=3749 RepID=A0A498HIE2_MALDO|nr:uncharacterized protein LOC126612154 [Malus sylvestris]RXH69157.1 hypothetical protein DVH24_031490 [Malus domestica]TQD95455.1 hypothetical protein C1H46_018940 [Malus baccata]
MAKVCCSIETEPRTLSEGQLNHAREIAADVVEKMEPTEASAIFIEGLRPVLDSVKEMKHMTDEEGEQLQLQTKLVEWKEEAQILEGPCQCLCSTAIVETPDQETRLTEPVSAPF